MTRDELMEQLVALDQFDTVPSGAKAEFLCNELQAILAWMANRPRPQPDAWESFYLVAAMGQLGVQNFTAAFNCSRRVFDIADRHPLIGMSPASVSQLERALATTRQASLGVRASADTFAFRNRRFPAAA